MDSADTTELLRVELHQHIKESTDTHAAVEAKISLLADRLLGVPERTIDGEIVRIGGMEAKLDALYSAQKNGGLNVHLPWGRLSVLIAFAVAVVELVRAVVERLD